MNQTDYWNSVADSRNFSTAFDEKIFSNYVSKNSKILDVGCGYGRTLNELYHAGYSDIPFYRGRLCVTFAKLLKNL